MKKILYTLFAVMSLASCSNDEITDFIPSSENLMIEGDGRISLSGKDTEEKKTLNIIASGRWRIDVVYEDGAGEEWLVLSETGGTGSKPVTINPAKPNPYADTPRTATLTITSVDTGLRQKVTVTQGGSVETLLLNSEAQTFDINGGRYIISVTCNSAWTVTGEQEWCTLDTTSGIGNGQVGITVAPNTSNSDRSTDLTFTSGDNVRVVRILQTEYVNRFALNHDERLFAAAGGEDVLTITSDTEWTVTSNSSWLDADVTSGSGNGTVIVTVRPTDITDRRTGTVTFSYKQGGTYQTVVCTYIQEGGKAPDDWDNDNPEH